MIFGVLPLYEEDLQEHEQTEMDAEQVNEMVKMKIFHVYGPKCENAEQPGVHEKIREEECGWDHHVETASLRCRLAHGRHMIRRLLRPYLQSQTTLRHG
jgi:hypothetical protein